MKKIIYFLTVTIVILSCSSCAKTGAVGPTGSTGDQGAVGPAGPAGANGKSGSIIFAGKTPPATSTGAIGDYYLNTSSGLLYGPKTTTGWGNGFSLAGATGLTGTSGDTGATGNPGATGATGTAGNTILSGTGIPDASLGNAGDFYMNTTSYLLYGPKLVSGWGTAVSLQGAPGKVQVEYSGWNYTTNPRDTTIDHTVLGLVDLAAPGLTENIINSGFIQVYLRYLHEGFPLPYTQGSSYPYVTTSFLPRKSKIILTRVTYDNTASGFETILQFRYVLIPGGKALAVKNHLDLNNYEAVRKFYRLKD